MSSKHHMFRVGHVDLPPHRKATNLGRTFDLGIDGDGGRRHFDLHDGSKAAIWRNCRRDPFHIEGLKSPPI